MGKGDKKSRRGKITIGSSGVRRPRKKKSRKPAHLSPEPHVANVIPESPPVVVVPETPPVEEHIEKKSPAKPAAKKVAGKKATEKSDEGGTKPKQTRTRKKAEEQPANLFSEKKEESE